MKTKKEHYENEIEVKNVKMIIELFKAGTLRWSSTWFDVDGTLVRKNKKVLTPLGKWVAKKGIAINVYTFGGWNAETIEKELGIKVNKCFTPAHAMIHDELVQDIDMTTSKKVPVIIDNEAQPACGRVYRVSFACC